MKTETIKTYTELTPLDAAELLVANKLEPIKGMYFRDDRGWVESTLVTAQKQTDEVTHPFLAGEWWKHCATMAEIDPCNAPDGCPPLEPWMAYVGYGVQAIFEGVSATESLGCYWLNDGKWVNGAYGINEKRHYAIDVRTEWAQKNLPEHCRIRNYKKPDPLREFMYALPTSPFYAHNPRYESDMKRAFELGIEIGQASPKSALDTDC